MEQLGLRYQFHMFTLPNLLTLFRIGLIVPIALLFYVPQAWAVWLALVLYIIGAVTDYFDGYFARVLNQKSAFGRFLDPIADKLLVASVLLLLAGFGRIAGFWLIPALVIMLREVLVAGLREFLAPSGVVIHVSRLAKWKTTAQLVALGVLIAVPAVSPYIPFAQTMGHVFLLAAAILTGVTGWQYITGSFKHIETMDDAA